MASKNYPEYTYIVVGKYNSSIYFLQKAIKLLFIVIFMICHFFDITYSRYPIWTI